MNSAGRHVENTWNMFTARSRTKKPAMRICIAGRLAPGGQRVPRAVVLAQGLKRLGRWRGTRCWRRRRLARRADRIKHLIPIGHIPALPHLTAPGAPVRAADALLFHKICSSLAHLTAPLHCNNSLPRNYCVYANIQYRKAIDELGLSQERADLARRLRAHRPELRRQGAAGGGRQTAPLDAQARAFARGRQIVHTPPGCT